MSQSNTPVPLRLILLTDEICPLTDEYWRGVLNRFCEDVFFRRPDMALIEDVVNIDFSMKDTTRYVHLFMESSSSDENDLYFVYLSSDGQIKEISREVVKEFTRWNTIPFRARAPQTFPEELNMWAWWFFDQCKCKPQRIFVKGDYLSYRAHGGQEGMSFRHFFLNKRRRVVMKAVK